VYAAQDDSPDRSTLKHIVVMLLSMALMCERAASGPDALRLLMFRLFSHAEIVAFGLFDGPAAGIDAWPDEPGRVRPDDLTALAARLRALAILIARVFLSGGETGTAEGAVPRPVRPAPCISRFEHPAAPFHDTS
jgi:hypothetical protein